MNDQQAIERYRYLLRTAPPDDIERAHEEAFAQLSPEQRAGVLRQLSEQVPVSEFGGFKQQHVRGTIGGVGFASNVMPAGAGRLALSVSKAMMTAAGIGVGDEAAFEVTAIGRD
jgi:hypothetical protein